ncbi:MAG TPA: HTH-type transcriptional regulator RutR [Azospirillaceae bacterium]|nr:HTH-type transcriptional regulator RutR [Azospirillaceae bacterium]
MRGQAKVVRTKAATVRTGGTGRKTRAGAANVDRILDAALAVFAAYGFHGARVGQIAEAAGLSKPNLLYYFASKEALYLALLERTLEAWLAPLAGLDPARDPEAALTDYIAAKFAMSRADPLASRLFAMEILQGAPRLLPVLEGELARMVAAKCRVIEGWIAEGRLAPIDPKHLIFMIWATTQHYADFATQVRAVAGRDLGDDAFHAETVAAVTRVLIQGVLPRT